MTDETIPCNTNLQDGTILDTLEPVTQLQSPSIGGLHFPSTPMSDPGMDCVEIKNSDAGEA